METYMYNTTPTRSTRARFSVNQASFSPGFAGSASREIEAFIWRCKQDNEQNTSYKSAGRELDSSSVTTFINMLTEVNTRCRKLEDQLLHLQEHTRRVTSQLDSFVSHHRDKSPISTAHTHTSSMDTMKAIRKLQWKIFDLQRENEALRGVLEVQRVRVDAEGEIASPPRPQEADYSAPRFYLDSEETSTTQNASEGSTFVSLDPSLSSDHQKADLKKDLASRDAQQQSALSSDRRVFQQKVNSDQQNPYPTPLSVQQSGYSETQKTRSTQEPSSADRRTVVDKQLSYNSSRNPQPISNFVTVDERLVQQMVISDDTKLVPKIEHPHKGINQKNTCGGMKIVNDKSTGETSSPTRSSSYSTKWTPSGKKKYHYSRPPVGREEWRWSSPSTLYPQASTKSSTKTENAQGIQSCYQSTPKSYYGHPHDAGVESHKHVGNISSLGYDYCNPDNVYSTDWGRTPCPNELGDLELGEFNLHASPEDIRLVQGTLELLSTINNMGYTDEEVTT